MEKTIYQKENGEVRVYSVDEKVAETIKKQCLNLCFGCDNAYSSKCDKIAGNMSKNIDKYDFITDGFAIIGNDGEIDSLLVEKCLNYAIDRPRKKMAINELKRLKESIKMHYFDAGSIEEANAIESYSREHNLLSDPEDTYICSRTYR